MRKNELLSLPFSSIISMELWCRETSGASFSWFFFFLLLQSVPSLYIWRCTNSYKKKIKKKTLHIPAHVFDSFRAKETLRRIHYVNAIKFIFDYIISQSVTVFIGICDCIRISVFQFFKCNLTHSNRLRMCVGSNNFRWKLWECLIVMVFRLF